MRGVEAVGVQDCGNVVLGFGEGADLAEPCEVFTVHDVGEESALGDGAFPCADLPGIAMSHSDAGFPDFIFCAEVHDDLVAVVVDVDLLLEGDDIGTGFNAGQKGGDVVLRDPVVVIDEGDVVTERGIEQGLTLESDGARAVVEEDEVLDGAGRALIDLRFEFFAERAHFVGAFPAGRGEDGEKGAAHGVS